MRKLIYISLLLFCGIAFSQSKIRKADKLFVTHNFSEAALIYEEYIDKNPNASADRSLLIKAADAFYFVNDHRKAAMYYKKAYAIGASLQQPYLSRYVRSLRGIREYDQANQIHLTYLDTQGDRMEIDKFKREIEAFKKLSESERESRFTIFNLEANSEYSDFGTVFFNERVVFSSARTAGGMIKEIYEWNNQPYLSLFVADRSEHGELSNIQPLSADITSNYHDATFSFSPNGESVYFASSNQKNRKKMILDKSRKNNFKLYKANVVDGKLTGREELFFNSNDYSIGHPNISPDGKYLFFAANMPGGFGDADIYYCEIYEDGMLSEPRNAGANINTSGNDFFPFFSSENKLYFSSNGHMGFGGLDIYESEFTPETGFSKAVNLGKVVNTAYDDFAMVFYKDNKNGYFSSNRPQGKGDDDLYAFFRKPEPCDQHIVGTVKDKSNGENLSEVKIAVKDSLNNIVYELFTDEEGKYEVKIPCNQTVTLMFSKDKYIDKSVVQEIGEVDGEEITLDIELDKLEDLIIKDDKTGIERINLKPIYFEFNKWDITPEAELVLEKAIEVMTIFPDMVIKIESHTDSRGRDSYNLELSDKRAKSTQAYLYSKGIAQERIESAIGYGESRLLNKCRDGVKCTDEEHDLNRRSDFVIIKR